MCITKDEVAEAINKALLENNKVRDDKWETRFSDMLVMVESSIEKRIQHVKSSPETQREINKINVLCAERGVSLSIMQKDINEIKGVLKDINEKLDKKYASKWVEKVISGLFIIFSLATLYFIFSKVGLPKP